MFALTACTTKSLSFTNSHLCGHIPVATAADIFRPKHNFDYVHTASVRFYFYIQFFNAAVRTVF